MGARDQQSIWQQLGPEYWFRLDRPFAKPTLLCDWTMSGTLYAQLAELNGACPESSRNMLLVNRRNSLGAPAVTQPSYLTTVMLKSNFTLDRNTGEWHALGYRRVVAETPHGDSQITWKAPEGRPPLNGEPPPFVSPVLCLC
jgi:hypothetical protein